DALARAAGELVASEPTLLYDRKLPRALVAQGRRTVADFPDAKKLDVAERLLAAGQTTAAVQTAAELPPAALGPEGQRRLHLLRARAFEKLGKIDASDREARLVGPGAEEGSAAALVTAENALRRALSRRGRSRRKLHVGDLPPDVARRLAAAFHDATAAEGTSETRMRGFRSEVALWVVAGVAAAALDAVRRMTAIDAGATWGFEALWKPVWEKIEAKDYSGALDGILALASVYHEISASRRLQYWSARCYEALGKTDTASELGRELPCADPADLYARFAEAWKTGCSEPAAPEPPERSGEFASVDELLRLRLYPEARREAERLPESRGRKLRLAVASFALGDFAAASSAVKGAFPQIGTAEEGEVPEQWRRLYYPLATGGLVESAAKEFGVDPSLFRALVRQESTFNARARSKAGAAGLTQLMPGTARLLSRTVLKKRFRRAFLYDPTINVRLGASYLGQLLRDFGNDRLMALAAYNAGPGRIRGFLRDHPGLPPDERIESLPAAETRDYVRRIFLYAESYRELYPEK
ncbi:MAG TPA: lytic transglycosylase domain-containing protein, partial [Thermoanaerobaculia bacterium]|nr:lytic transglycosylase domain-containing protein [Thermoanaerobaculia bacterium]